jgi:hypothetical protein
MLRRGTPGKSRHRKVEGSPKEMNRAHLSRESGPKLLEDAVRLYEG